jgi:hypothetical protein
MSTIKKTGEDIGYNVNGYYEVDKGMFTVKASVYSTVSKFDHISETIYHHDINDANLDFYVDGKHCKYDGFKELYGKLFGVDSFSAFCSDIIKEIEDYHRNTSIYPGIESLTKSQLIKCWKQKFEVVDKAVDYVSLDKNGKMLYADDFEFRLITKLLYPEIIERWKLPYAHGKNDQAYEHEVVNLNNFI